MKALCNRQACVAKSICPLRTHARPVLRLLSQRTTPEAIKDGLLPSSDARGLTPPTAIDAAPGSRITNRGVKRAGRTNLNPEADCGSTRPAEISCRRFQLENSSTGVVVSNWRRGPRRSEGFSLVGGVPKVTLKNCILRVLKTGVSMQTVIPATGLLSPAPTRSLKQSFPKTEADETHT